MPGVVGIIQARMGSTRLPGKTLAPILGRPLIGVLLERVRGSAAVEEWVVATSVDSRDDPLARAVERLGVRVSRGSEDDVLDRFYRAAEQLHPRIVLRLTGDNPLLDGAFVDMVARRFSEQPCDYAETTQSKTYPLGLSVEIMTFEALSQAWSEDSSLQGREHVTPFLYRNSQRFRVVHLTGQREYSPVRCTVDTPADLEFIRQLFSHFGRTTFSWQEAVEAARQHPEWSQINRHVEQRKVDS